jgi:hypothetical protein
MPAALVTIEPSSPYCPVTYFQYPGEYSILVYLFISAHQHQYRAHISTGDAVKPKNKMSPTDQRKNKN